MNNISNKELKIPKKYLKLLDNNYLINLKNNLKKCYDDYSYIDTYHGFYSQVNDDVLSLCIYLENNKLNNKDFLLWIDNITFLQWEEFMYDVLRLMIIRNIIEVGNKEDYDYNREDDLFSLHYADKLFKAGGHYKKLMAEFMTMKGNGERE